MDGCPSQCSECCSAGSWDLRRPDGADLGAGDPAGDRRHRDRVDPQGVIAGLLIGLFTRKVRSLLLGIAFGLAMGLLFAYFVAAMQGKYYFEIMLPGAIVGLIVGYATYVYGDAARPAAAA